MIRMAQKIFLLILFSLFSLTAISLIRIKFPFYGEWQEIAVNEVYTPDVCDYRIIINNPSNKVVEDYFQNLDYYTISPSAKSELRLVDLYFKAENRSSLEILNLIPQQETERFHRQLLDHRYTKDCTIHIFSQISLEASHKNYTSKNEYAITCWSTTISLDTTPYQFANKVDIVPEVIKLQKRCK